MAKKPLSPLRKLQIAAHQLNELSDRTAQQVKALEVLLNETSLGVSVQVHISPQGPFKRTLQYRRRDDRSFHIAVVTHMPGSRPDDVKPWDQCTRETKLEAVKSLPELLEKLSNAIEERIEEAANALDSITNILELERQGEANDGRQ